MDFNKFNELADEWTRATRNISSLSRIMDDANAKELEAMGPGIVPLILERIKTNPWFWHRILRNLTGANPLTPEMAGKLQEQMEAWIKWGEENAK